MAKSSYECLKNCDTNSVVVQSNCCECGANCYEKIDFLMDLPDDKREQILAHTRREHYDRDDYLFREGSRVDAIYFIYKGKVKLSTYDGYGKEQIMGIFADGDTIWEGILMGESRYPYGAACVTDVECLKVDRVAFEKLLKEPDIALRMIAILSKKLHNANERSRILSMTEPKARVAGFLLYRLHQAEENQITLRLDDIAASVNLRPETVSRKVREMEKAGLIERTGQSTLKILDPAGLEEVFSS